MSRAKAETEQLEPTRARIMDAAERVFAELGYDGSSVRKIATLASVPVALINYHFGSKEGLYRALFEKRVPTIYDQRVTGLQLARSEPDLDRRIELVVKALIYPMFNLRGSEKSSYFGQIMARELSDPSAETRGIFRDMFDPVAQMMIEAIAECFPHWTKAEVHWAYHTMLGAMMLVMMDNGRIARLSDGACSSQDYEDAARHMVAILTAGMKYRDRTMTKNS
ncbi:CerR family C-terminal domain-containing protein [uncultured Roseibium sp.]|uniref:TetR/AcrR family transcriptional regulator n=1 Tax=uncultured Roseibium sp. TaxID=1936171 RepID=UPI003216A00F